MPDEGKNKQAKPEPGSPEARRQTLMWWLWLAIGVGVGVGVRWLLSLLNR
ncbi:MAG: hypothetical protein ACM3XN_06000 [Chloroflexota bacterium]